MFLTHLSKVRGTKILSLKIDYMDFYHGWRFFEMSRARLVGALCKFIRKQRHLQFIDISGAQIDFRDGGRVLKALAACHAKNTLQTLQMKDFFELRYMAPHNDSFLAALRKFTTLKHLYLNFIYLNQTVLDILGKKLGTTLESLRLVIDSSEPQGRVLSHYDWTNFRERSPNCKVIFHFLGMMSQIEYTSALCRGAQVVEVDILSWEGYPNDLEPDTERMSEVVMHIANNFYKDLVRFRISIDHTSEDPLDNSLIYLLQKCTKLREFTINAAMTLATVDTICKLAAQRMPKILDHLELRVRGLSPENTSQLALITQAYMNQINTRQLELRSD
ncbi:uncharacterized protein LOC126823674 [Patella vulgata]|uniref:uncharacterized protein LOC126823674 n=1 Tax=Patella vulgata TaxID=6465 RepID=UPI0024A983BD|nr:uncharacterized protein LOC126823674 [Patella vulgata]